MTARLVQIEGNIADLKGKVAASPKDESLAAQLEDVIREYDRISALMGGDRAAAQSSAKTGSAEPAAVAVIPPSPPGCTATTATFSNSTPTPIPDNNPAGATSTITVAGAGTSTWDVNVTVNITHTFAADLDFTLTSPTGTVVTLSTDNGGGNDNVFNGTTFDDQANPGSQIPYAAQPNQVVDNTYANLTVAASLTPEEPLAAFNAQNPNGTWTLKVVDDLGGDSGTINSWVLEITTFPVAPATAMVVASNSTPVAIPDNNPTGATSTIAVAGAGTSTCDVNVTVNIPHTFAADLDFTLTSPSGKIVTLSTDNGGGNDNVFNGTTFDDQANPGSQIPYAAQPNQVVDNTYANNVVAVSLTPEEPLALFNGDDPNGTWTLKVVDDLGGDTGTINSWSLTITTCSCASACTSITCPANVTQTNDPNQCGAVVTYPAPTPNGTCGTINCAPASGSFFPVGTTTVTCTSTAGPSCTFTVTVQDTQPPSITCPANITRSNDPNQCGAVVTYPAPTITDNCPGTFTPTCTPASGSFFPVGTTTVTCSVNGFPASTCAFTITVNDTQPPQITCPPNQTAVTDQNACPAPPCQTVNYPAPVASDNCPGVTVVCNPPSGSCFSTGVTTVTCTATDASGNTATCTFTVTTFDTALQDDSNPSIVLLWNSLTGAYRFCCNGTTFTGVGKSTIQGCVFTLQHNATDRRVLGRVDKAVHAGSASIQAPPGTIRCTIADRNTLNDFPACQ